MVEVLIVSELIDHPKLKSIAGEGYNRCCRDYKSCCILVDWL